MAEFTGTDAEDKFAGSNSEADVFVFSVLTLGDDTLDGGGNSLGSPLDRLRIIDAGTVDTDHPEITRIEQIVLSAGGNELRLDRQIFESAINQTIYVTGTGLGHDLIVGLDNPNFRNYALVVHGGGGDDTVLGTAGRDTLFGEGGNDVLSGGQTGPNKIYGGAGDDALSGSDGDTLIGGMGDDTFSLRGIGSVGTIDGGAGFDLLYASSILSLENLKISGVEALTGNTIGGRPADFRNFSRFTDLNAVALSASGTLDLRETEVLLTEAMVVRVSLAPGVAVRVFGNKIVNDMRGGIGDDTLLGNGSQDTLWGGDGNDVIVGGDGRDDLRGQAGDDLVRGGQGADTLSNMASDFVTLSTGSDTLAGEEGNDLIELLAPGQGERVVVRGGAGNDIIQYSSGDFVKARGYIDGGDGFDTVDLARDFHSPQTSLGNYSFHGIERLVLGRATLSASPAQLASFSRIGFEFPLESLELNVSGEGFVNLGTKLKNFDGALTVLAGGRSGIDVMATAGDDKMVGNLGADTLNGGAGNDTIDGGFGSDILKGGQGEDVFSITTAFGSKNIDRLMDMTPAEDVIQLSGGLVGVLDTGVVEPWNVVIGPAATTSYEHLIYNPGSGNLYYDSNGAGGVAKVLMARLPSGLGLSYADFVLV